MHQPYLWQFSKAQLVGGFNSSEKYERQLGWFFPIYRKIKHVPNHQPDSIVRGYRSPCQKNHSCLVVWIQRTTQQARRRRNIQGQRLILATTHGSCTPIFLASNNVKTLWGFKMKRSTSNPGQFFLKTKTWVLPCGNQTWQWKILNEWKF